MNLAELLDRTGVELRHDPNSTQERNNRAAAISDEYLKLCSEHRWSFLQKIATIALYPQIDVTDMVTFNPFGLTFNNFRLNWFPGVFVGGYVDRPTSLALVMRPDVMGDRWDTDTLYTSPTGYTAPGALQTIRLRQRVKLPADCIEVLGIVSRDDDRGPLAMVDLHSEREYMLNADDEGDDPTAYMVDPPQALDRSPYATLAVAEAGAGSAYTVGVTYRYFYAYYFAGRYSGRSNIAEVTQAGAATLHRLTGWEDWSATPRGTERHIFRADGADRPFRYVTSIDWTHVGNLDIVSTTTPDEDQPWVDPSPASYLRFWPHPPVEAVDATGGVTIWNPTSQQNYELRYRYRPTRLVHDLDTPHIPVEFHPLLVDRVVERLAMQRGDKDLAAFALKSGREKFDLMRRRYLTTTAQDHRFRDWTTAGGALDCVRPRITRLP